MSRSQVHLCLPTELMEQGKQQAKTLGLSFTAYVANLIAADLGQGDQQPLVALERRVRELELRLMQNAE